MANRVILHQLGYYCNLYAGIGDQLKTLNVIGYHKHINANVFWLKLLDLSCV